MPHSFVYIYTITEAWWLCCINADHIIPDKSHRAVGVMTVYIDRPGLPVVILCLSGDTLCVLYCYHLDDSYLWCLIYI